MAMQEVDSDGYGEEAELASSTTLSAPRDRRMTCTIRGYLHFAGARVARPLVSRGKVSLSTDRLDWQKTSRHSMLCRGSQRKAKVHRRKTQVTRMGEAELPTWWPVYLRFGRPRCPSPGAVHMS